MLAIEQQEQVWQCNARYEQHVCACVPSLALIPGPALYGWIAANSSVAQDLGILLCKLVVGCARHTAFSAHPDLALRRRLHSCSIGDKKNFLRSFVS